MGSSEVNRRAPTSAVASQRPPMSHPAPTAATNRAFALFSPMPIPVPAYGCGMGVRAVEGKKHQVVILLAMGCYPGLSSRPSPTAHCLSPLASPGHTYQLPLFPLLLLLSPAAEDLETRAGRREVARERVVAWWPCGSAGKGVGMVMARDGGNRET